MTGYVLSHDRWAIKSTHLFNQQTIAHEHTNTAPCYIYNKPYVSHFHCHLVPAPSHLKHIFLCVEHEINPK